VIKQLTGHLKSDAVRLDTALLFAEFRDSATADERRRLAREMHDGVAQDIASLGYLVDALAAKPSSPQQGEQFRVLRDRISHVVAEVRQSVLTLRTSVGENESLGAAISSVARNLSEVSGIPIHVTLDEHTTRLRPEVEAELYRISQEAMNNAIKHAQATAITVHCQVHAPGASITVADDGRGMQQARNDSHGLQIMRERARLINAELTIDSSREGGLAVRVHISGDESRDGYQSSEPTEEVSS
jgi:signal transduction histidine kinase